jgi:hypothetical protein
MDATIAPAVIGVAGAVLVAVVSSVTTARTIRQSLADGRLSARAALDAGHEERVWDMKAALYVELLLAEAKRRTERELRRRDFESAKYGERPRGPLLSYDEQAWSSFDARLRAFGSALVVQAFQEAMLASYSLRERDEEWQDGGVQVSAAEIRLLVLHAMEQADEADGALASQIRADLQAPLSASAALARLR